MKRTLAIIACLLIPVLAIGASLVSGSAPIPTNDPVVYSTGDNSLLVQFPNPSHYMMLKPDGTILLDGHPIQELSHPEIKAILAEISKELRESNEGWRSMCERQTDNLLSELQRCKSQLKGEK